MLDVTFEAPLDRALGARVRRSSTLPFTFFPLSFLPGGARVLPIFPLLVDLPLEKFQGALAHILQAKYSTLFRQRSAHTGPALTPVEVLVAIHGIVPEKDDLALKKARLPSSTLVLQVPFPFSPASGGKSVESVNLDKDKDLMMVKGAMDANQMIQFLKVKLKWNVVVVPPKKDDGKTSRRKEEKQEPDLKFFEN
ncbi:Phosphoenolpyruvate carboxykinase of ATP [Spatholobus suberectus]|nr:Phosphoenolpyruvate carboxykinase of ATP [Spatholobus suberectus]